MGCYIATGCKDNISLAALIVAGPVPNTNAFCAMLNSVLGPEKLDMLLLIGDNHIDIVHAAEAMVHHGQEAVSIWRKVYAYYLGVFVCDDVQEPGILMREAVVVLSPDNGSEKKIE